MANDLSRLQRRVFSGVVLVALFAITLEVTCRIEDRIAHGVPFFSRVVGPGDLILLDAQGARGRPNARFGKWRMDSLGFRGPEVAELRPARSLRVVVEGASETFGLYESPNKEYPRQLEDSLRRMAAMCGANAPAVVEVINGALPGMALPSMVHHLTTVVAPLHPDVIVLYPSPAFYLDVRPPKATTRSAPADSALPALNAWRPRAIGRLRSQLKGIVPGFVLTVLRRLSIWREVRGHSPEWKMRSVPEERVALFDHDLREAVGAAKRSGARVVLMAHVNQTLFPTFGDDAVLVSWENQFPNTTGATLADFHRRTRDVSIRVARDSTVDLVDPLVALEDNWRKAFADFVHFTDFGSSVIAQTLAPRVLSTLGEPSRCARGSP